VTLYEIRDLLDKVSLLHSQGHLTRFEVSLLRKGCNQLAFQSLKDRVRETPSEEIYQEVSETGFHAVEQAVRRFYGHV
jgi:hypothetical protein